jgi:hypothetical protein
VALLPGWEASEGARAEHAIAIALGAAAGVAVTTVADLLAG